MLKPESKADKLLKLLEAGGVDGVSISIIEQQIDPKRAHIYGIVHQVRREVIDRKQTILLKGDKYFLTALDVSKVNTNVTSLSTQKFSEKMQLVLNHLTAHNDTGSSVDELAKAADTTKISVYSLIKSIKQKLPPDVKIKSSHARYFLKEKGTPVKSSQIQKHAQANSNMITEALTMPVAQQTLTIEDIAALPSASERSDAIEYMRQAIFYSMVARDVVNARRVTNHLRLQIERLVPVR